MDDLGICGIERVSENSGLANGENSGSCTVGWMVGSLISDLDGRCTSGVGGLLRQVWILHLVVAPLLMPGQGWW